MNPKTYLKENNIGFITQKYSNFPRMTVSENIIQGTHSIDKDKLDALLTHFDMYNQKDKYPDQLS